MPINKKPIKLSWADEDYEIKITYGLIDTLEEEFDLMKFYLNFTRGKIHYGKSCMLLVILLNSVGCKVTWEDMWESVFSEDSRSIHGAALISLLWEIFGSIFIPSKKNIEGSQPNNVKVTHGKKSMKS